MSLNAYFYDRIVPLTAMQLWAMTTDNEWNIELDYYECSWVLGRKA